MVAFVGRVKALRLSASGIEWLAARESDYARPIMDELAGLIVKNEALIAGEIAHVSSGVALADRLLDESPISEPIIMLGTTLVHDQLSADGRMKHPSLWWMLDVAAILARLVWRFAAPMRPVTPIAGRVLFVTNARQASMISGQLPSPAPPILNLRLEHSIKTRRRNHLVDLLDAWRSTGSRSLGFRIRLARLRFEAAPLRDAMEDLVANGLHECLLGDVTGHRARLVAGYASDLGLGVKVFQHGRIGNPCKYVPPSGVLFVARSEEDLQRIREVGGAGLGDVSWSIAPAPPTRRKRSGTGVLVCPTVIGSAERFLLVEAAVARARASDQKVGVRFHPDERFPRWKARRLGAEYVSSDGAIKDLPMVWGRAIVPLMSTARDELADAGFEIL